MVLVLNILVAVMFGYLAFKSAKSGTVETVFGTFQRESHPKKFMTYVLSLVALAMANMFLIFLRIL
jgi:hypothetical protein